MKLELNSVWSVDLPESFRRIENVDSLQADDGSRTIFLSSMKVNDPETGSPVPAKRLHEMQGSHPARSFELADNGRLGRAHLLSETKGRLWWRQPVFHLRATREADGTVLACVITYSDPADLDWALEIWRSIRGPAVA